MITPIKLYGTTLADGSLTVSSGTVVKGLLHSVSWIKGTFDNGVDFSLVTPAYNDAPETTLFSLSDADVSQVYRPRGQVCGVDGTLLTLEGTEPATDKMVVDGILRLVVAQGGNGKAGGCIAYIET